MATTECKATSQTPKVFRFQVLTDSKSIFHKTQRATHQDFRACLLDHSHKAEATTLQYDRICSVRTTSNNRINQWAIILVTECQAQQLAAIMIHKFYTNSCYSSSKCAHHLWADLLRPTTNHKVLSIRAADHLFRVAGYSRLNRCIPSRLSRVISDINYSSQCSSNFHRIQKGTLAFSHPSQTSSSFRYWHSSRPCNSSRTNL